MRVQMPLRAYVCPKSTAGTHGRGAARGLRRVVRARPDRDPAVAERCRARRSRLRAATDQSGGPTGCAGPGSIAMSWKEKNRPENVPLPRTALAARACARSVRAPRSAPARRRPRSPSRPSPPDAERGSHGRPTGSRATRLLRNHARVPQRQQDHAGTDVIRSEAAANVDSATTTSRIGCDTRCGHRPRSRRTRAPLPSARARGRPPGRAAPSSAARCPGSESHSHGGRRCLATPARSTGAGSARWSCISSPAACSSAASMAAAILWWWSLIERWNLRPSRERARRVCRTAKTGWAEIDEQRVAARLEQACEWKSALWTNCSCVPRRSGSPGIAGRADGRGALAATPRGEPRGRDLDERPRLEQLLERHAADASAGRGPQRERLRDVRGGRQRHVAAAAAPFAVRMRLCAVSRRRASRTVARLTPKSSASWTRWAAARRVRAPP